MNPNRDEQGRYSEGSGGTSLDKVRAGLLALRGNTLSASEQAHALATLEQLPKIEDKYSSGGSIVRTRDVFKGGPQQGLTSLTEQEYAGVTEETIPIDALIPSQPSLEPAGLKAYIANPSSELPSVIQIGNKFHVLDHHRLAVQILSGRTHAIVKVYHRS